MVGLGCSWVVGLLGCWAVVAFCCFAVGLLGWWAGRLFDSWVLFLLLGFMFVIGLSCSWVAGLLSCWAVVAFGCWAGAVVGLVGCWATGCWAIGLGCWVLKSFDSPAGTAGVCSVLRLYLKVAIFQPELREHAAHTTSVLKNCDFPPGAAGARSTYYVST